MTVNCDDLVGFSRVVQMYFANTNKQIPTNEQRISSKKYNMLSSNEGMLPWSIIITAVPTSECEKWKYIFDSVHINIINTMLVSFHSITYLLNSLLT